MAATLPRVAVLGASGFAGGEVLRLLSAHPGVTVAHASSERWAGYPARAVLPALRHVPALRQLRLKPLAELPSVDLAIACLPAGELPPRLGSVAAQAPMVLNMAGDYRLTDPAQVAAYYPTTLDHPLPAAGQPRYHVPEFTPPRLGIGGVQPAGLHGVGGGLWAAAGGARPVGRRTRDRRREDRQQRERSRGRRTSGGAERQLPRPASERPSP